jgi:hypothetical protein
VLQQRVVPQLQAAGVQLRFVTCGNTRAIDAWAQATAFPLEEVRSLSSMQLG